MKCNGLSLECEHLPTRQLQCAAWGAERGVRLNFITTSRRNTALCLHDNHRSVTLSHMKASTMTIRLDAKIQRELDRLSRRLGRSRSDIVRDAVRRQVALLRFEQSRRTLLPLAEAQGILTDEDVFRIVS